MFATTRWSPIEGRTVAIEYRWAGGKDERLADIAAEFVRLKVNVIVTSATPPTVAVGEQHLRHILMSYMDYYNAARTHLSLGKDAPVRRLVQRAERIEVRPVLGGLHHQYVRI